MGMGRGRVLALKDTDPPEINQSLLESISEISYGVSGRDLLNEDHDFDNLSQILETQGFNGMPTELTPEEMEAHIANGGLDLYRGVKANRQTYFQYKEEFLNGDFYVEGGEAYFGRGMYVFDGSSGPNAFTQAGKYGIVSRMSLSLDARIADFETIRNESNEWESSRGNVPGGFGNSLFEAALMGDAQEFISDNRRAMTDYVISDNFAAARGYDAIRIPRSYVLENSSNHTTCDFMIILNRSKVLVDYDYGLRNMQ